MANQSIKEAFQRFWEYVTAKIDNQTMVVTVTKNDSTYTADRTYSEIAAHFDAGGKCEAVYVSGSLKYVMKSVARISGAVIFTSTDFTNALSHKYIQIYEDGKISYGSRIALLSSDKGVANGVAPLDASSQIDAKYIPMPSHSVKSYDLTFSGLKNCSDVTLVNSQWNRYFGNIINVQFDVEVTVGSNVTDFGFNVAGLPEPWSMLSDSHVDRSPYYQYRSIMSADIIWVTDDSKGFYVGIKTQSALTSGTYTFTVKFSYITLEP